MQHKSLTLIAFLCAAAHAATGLFFFLDPTRNLVAGSDVYWQVLAQQHWGRQAFLASFAFIGVFALGLVQAVRTSADATSSIGQWLANLALLGYAVSAVSYFRLLGGEAKRALAYSQGDAAVQAVIRSFSLVLDPLGWLTFAAVGAFIFWASWRAWQTRKWPRFVAALGMAVALGYLCAWLGLLWGLPVLVKVSAGLGATVLAPIWWVAWGLVNKPSVKP
jgi:hypothetical protein